MVYTYVRKNNCPTPNSKQQPPVLILLPLLIVMMLVGDGDNDDVVKEETRAVGTPAYCTINNMKMDWIMNQ
jgi:hypothetical protein